MEADIFGNQQEITNKRSFPSFDRNNKLTKDLMKSRESLNNQNQQDQIKYIRKNVNSNNSSGSKNNNNNDNTHNQIPN